MMLTFLAAAVCAAPLADWYVDGNHPACSTGNGSASSPFCHIADALAVAASGDRVLVAPGVYAELLDVPGGVSVIGLVGAEVTTVDGQQLGATVTTRAGAPVTLEGLTLRGGRATGHGGGVRAEGSLILTRVEIVDNEATQLGGGLALVTPGATLTIVASLLRGNLGQIGGGGLFADAPSALLVEDTQVLDNVAGGDGGGASVGGGVVRFRRCEFARNTAAISGGGLIGSGSLTLEASTFDANESVAFGGGLEWLGGGAQIVNVTFSANRTTGGFGGGGGALLQSMPASAVRVDHCTFTANEATDGGGLLVAHSAAGATLSNSAFVGNSASSPGGGDDLRGAIISLGSNLFGDVAGASLAPTDRLGVPANLAPLRHNGGPTPTHVPLPISAAIDGAASSLLAFDQRAAVRPTGAADVGAVEVLGAQVACAVVPNTSGSPAYLVATGDEVASANALGLIAGDLPPARFGFFLVGTSTGSIMGPSGSVGVQCVAGSIGRLNRSSLGEIQLSDSRGVIELAPDLTQLATPSGVEAVLAGDTRVFQLWFRDGVAQPSSNFSAALALTFR